MSPDEVALFLRTNPQFFDQHPELLDSITLTHPHGGRAIPLAERQMVALREKARLLETKLGELIQFGEQNDAIAEKVHRLSLALVSAPDFASIAQALYFHLREDFTVPHVALRVWGRPLPEGRPEADAVDEAVRDEASNMAAPHCGPATGSATLQWFGETAAHVRSIARVPLGETSVFGLLVLGSEDAERFYAEMGTLYLRRIGELCAAAIARRA